MFRPHHYPTWNYLLGISVLNMRAPNARCWSRDFTNKSPALPAVGGASFLGATLWESYCLESLQVVAVLSIALVVLDLWHGFHRR